jgi:hypothetical protein
VLDLLAQVKTIWDNMGMTLGHFVLKIEEMTRKLGKVDPGRVIAFRRAYLKKSGMDIEMRLEGDLPENDFKN